MKIVNLSLKVAAKWVAAGKLMKFLENDVMKFHVCTTLQQPSIPFQDITPAGRPRKKFEESSFIKRKRRVENFVQSRSDGKLMTAGEVTVLSIRKRTISKQNQGILSILKCYRELQKYQFFKQW